MLEYTLSICYADNIVNTRVVRIVFGHPEISGEENYKTVYEIGDPGSPPKSASE